MLWPTTVSIGVGLAALAAYLPTVAPTITWRNGGSDSGDLAAAVVTLGIPHPPGYPTYVLLGQAWTLLPLGGEPAFRLNLLSAVSASLAAAGAAATIFRLCGTLGLSRSPSAAGAALGGLALALAPLCWSQATVTEVYAPGLAVLSLLGLLLLGSRSHSDRHVLAAGLVGGLGLGMLPQLALTAPGGLGLLVGRAGGSPMIARRLGLAVAAGGLGLLTFAYLPIRAAANPPLNWGDPSTPARFWQVVTADQYRYLFASLGAAEWLARLLDGMVLLADNLTPPGLILAIVGAGLLVRARRAELGYLLSLGGLTLLFRTAYLAEGNAVYLLPAIYALAVLAGLGVAVTVARSGSAGPRHSAILLAAGLLVLLATRAALTAPSLNLSDDRAAGRFAAETLAGLPAGAVMVTDREEATFSLWYRQALGERPDVVVIDGRLLFRDWYQHNLARRYPDLDPAALRPGGLTALDRPIYVLAGEPGKEVPRPVHAAAR